MGLDECGKFLHFEHENSVEAVHDLCTPIQLGLSFGLCNSECIRSKNPFQIIFGAKNVPIFFLKIIIPKMYKVSRVNNTITK